MVSNRTGGALFLSAALFMGVADATAMGALKMDNYTFDKVIGIPGHTVLAKFDQSYPYGEKEDQFKELTKLAHGVPQFFIGEVPVQEYGDKENDDLREKFGLKKDDFPVYILFKGPENKETYDGKITAEEIGAWLRRKGVRMPSVGTITEMDEIVKKFLKGGMAPAEIEAVKKLADGDFKNDKKAPMYVKIMEKIKEKGVEYIKTETARVEKIMGGKLTPEKKTELSDKMKILNVFGEEL